MQQSTKPTMSAFEKSIIEVCELVTTPESLSRASRARASCRRPVRHTELFKKKSTRLSLALSSLNENNR